MSRTHIGTALTVMGLLAIVALSAWLRAPGFMQGGFASHDVGGILYNAMVIEHGGLAYVDTLELKAPGSFYLATWFAGPEGRDIARFQIAANLWALLGLVGVAGLGWRMWGRIGALAGAGLHALHDANLDSMDANYVTWANLPQILAFWLGIEALRSSSTRLRASMWMVAGAFAGFAALCKQQNGVVLLVLLGMAWLAGREANPPVAREASPHAAREASLHAARTSPSWRDRGWAPGLVLAGFTLAHVPIAARYLAAGQLDALIHGYVLNRWGLRYVVARDVGLLDAMREGGLATAHFLGLALVLAAFAAFVALGRQLGARRSGVVLDEREREQLRFVALVSAWVLATLLSASIGFRFYKGYFLAMAAPLCVLAAAPIGLLGRRCTMHTAPRAIVLLLASVLVGRTVLLLDVVRRDRAQPHDEGARRIAAHIVEHSSAEDQIWVWGWHLWDVYALTGRMAGTRIYKSLGILTQPNDDTWRRRASPQRFIESEHSQQLLAELDANRPTFIVFGSTVPHREFTQLHEFLRRHYRRDHGVRIGRVQIWRRKAR
jgi:hypothetical protein